MKKRGKARSLSAIAVFEGISLCLCRRRKRRMASASKRERTDEKATELDFQSPENRATLCSS